MSTMVFRNDLQLKEYPQDHVRIIMLRVGEDEQEAVKRYSMRDATLGTYLGLVDDPPKKIKRWRNCWRYLNGVLVVDIKLAVEQYMREIRIEQVVRLNLTDKDKLRLDEIGTDAQRASLKVYRQSLRDLPDIVVVALVDVTTITAIETYDPPWPNLNLK